MAVQLITLKPYKSFVLARIKEEFGLAGLLNFMMEDLSGMLTLGEDSRRRLVTRSAAQDDGELEIGFIHFIENHPVTWTSDVTITDATNHLVLVCRRNRHVVICVTDSSFRSSLVSRFDKGESPGLGALQSISAGIMNAAFVRGTARTLWLSATHRRTTVKADSKILSGIDLRDALSPVEDQSYYFTAARCGVDLDGIDGSIGSAPRKSKVWVGLADDWDDFRNAVVAILTRLEETKRPEPSPLPIIAVTTIDAHKVKGAFDVAVVSPELATDDPALNEEVRSLLERWSYGADFEIIETEGPSFSARLSLEGERIGTISFDVNVNDPERVTWHLRGEPDSDETEDRHREALELCSHHDWLKIWYDSGHALSSQSLFEIRYRDMPFRGYRWGGFAEFDVTKEKPDPLDAIGQQSSLFCWVKGHWPRGSESPGAWLACDDGAMEIADFIHLDNTSEPPIVSLVHVKGAGSNRTNRGISVSKYEVVTGQAVKNLRSLDRLILEEGIRDGIGRKIGSLVWHNREPSTRGQMLDALGAIGTDYERRVVIVQPHLKRSTYEQARERPRSRDAARLRQLDALLLGAEAAVHGNGATLIAIGER